MDGAACVAQRAPVLYARNNRPLKCADMSSLDPPTQCQPAPDDCVAFDATTGRCTVCAGRVNDGGACAHRDRAAVETDGACERLRRPTRAQRTRQAA